MQRTIFLAKKDEINLYLTFAPSNKHTMRTLFTSDELELKYPEIHGISTSMRHVRLGFLLSKHSDLDVDYYEDVVNYNKDSTHAAYVISFLDDQSKCLLVKNRGSKGLFYAKYKKADYLLCAIDEDEINIEIVKIVNKIDEISICFVLSNPNQKEILNFTNLQ